VSGWWENLNVRRHVEKVVLFLLLHSFVCERHLAYQHGDVLVHNLTSLLRKQAFNLSKGKRLFLHRRNPNFDLG
jgi:hypothetical protein